MQTYIGTKVIDAEPMTRGAYNEHRGWTIPANEDPADEGYIVRYPPDGHISWSPKHVFEASYRPAETLDFGGALAALRQGLRVARSGWSGAGMFAYLVPAAAYPVQTGAAKAHFGEGSLVPYRAYLALKTVDNDVATWAPSASDVLAEDWRVIPEAPQRQAA